MSCTDCTPYGMSCCPMCQEDELDPEEFPEEHAGGPEWEPDDYYKDRLASPPSPVQIKKAPPFQKVPIENTCEVIINSKAIRL